MLVKTKNTFITIEFSSGDSSQDNRARARCTSCPEIFCVNNSEMDSQSTTGSHMSPMLTASRGAFTSVLIRNAPGSWKLSDVVTLLSERGFLVPVENISIKKCNIDHVETCLIEITPHLANLSMSLFHLFHGEFFGGNELSVELTNSALIPNKRRGPISTRKVFVGGLRAHTSSRSLRLYFSRFGDIEDCGVISDFAGVSRRFGFCEFANEESFYQVLKLQHQIDGHIASVRPYCHRE